MSAFLSEWIAVLIAATGSGSLMALGVYLLFRFLPRGFSDLRAWLWWMVGVKFLLGLFLAFPLLLPVPTILSPSIIVVSTTPSVLSETPAVAPNPSPPEVVQPSVPFLLAMAAFLVWSIGGMVYITFFIRQVVTVHRILCNAESLDDTVIGAVARRMAARLGLNRPPRVLVSESVTAPLTTNPFRPVILLPAALVETLGDDEIEMTLAHELAHIHRGDLLLAIPFAIAQVVFWFFPPVWFSARAWDTARETACDEMALRLTGSTPAVYGTLLIKIIEADHRQMALPALGVTSSFHTLKERLNDLRLVSATPRRQRLVTGGLSLVGLVMTLALHVSAQDRIGKTDTDAANPIRNAGFEKGAATPTEWTYGTLLGVPEIETVRDTAVRHSGRASLRFVKTAQTFAPVALFSQALAPFPVETKRVRVRVWVKAINARKATVAIFFRDKGGEIKDIKWGAYIGEANDGDKPANHDWKVYETVLPVPKGTHSLAVTPEMYGSGSVWFDDLSIAYEDANGKQLKGKK